MSTSSTSAKKKSSSSSHRAKKVTTSSSSSAKKKSSSSSHRAKKVTTSSSSSSSAKKKSSSSRSVLEPVARCSSSDAPRQTITSRNYNDTYYSDYYSSSEEKPGHRLFPGFSTLVDVNTALEPRTGRTWCHGADIDHGCCRKEGLRSPIVLHQKTQNKKFFISSSSSSAIVAPAESKCSKSSMSKGSKSKSSKSSVKPKSSSSSSSKKAPSIKSRALSKCGSGSVSSSKVISAGSRGTGMFSHIHPNGYHSDQLDLNYRTCERVTYHGDINGDVASSFRMAPGSGQYKAHDSSPRNIYKRENFRLGKDEIREFGGLSFVPPMPTTEDPYQHRRANKARFGDVLKHQADHKAALEKEKNMNMLTNSNVVQVSGENFY